MSGGASGEGGDSGNPEMAAVLKAALKAKREARKRAGEHAYLSYSVLAKMLRDWLGDDDVYVTETVRKWITEGRDAGFSVQVALLDILTPDADLKAIAKQVYQRRRPHGTAAEDVPHRGRRRKGAKGATTRGRREA